MEPHAWYGKKVFSAYGQQFEAVLETRVMPGKTYYCTTISSNGWTTAFSSPEGPNDDHLIEVAGRHIDALRKAGGSKWPET